MSQNGVVSGANLTMPYRVIIRKRVKLIVTIALVVLSIVIAIGMDKDIFFHNEDFVEEDRVDSTDEFLNIGDIKKVVSDLVSRDISLDTSFLNNGYLFSTIEISGLELGHRKLSGDIFIKGRFIKDNLNRVISFSGKGFARNIKIGSEILMPITLSFRVINDELNIEVGPVGKSYKLKGKIALKEPFETDIYVDILRAGIKNIAVIAKAKDSDVVLGVMKGLFHIKGPLSNLFVTGVIESRNGRIGDKVYDFMAIRLEGYAPIINIVDSRIKQGSGTIAVEGYIDLRDIVKGNLSDGLRMISDMKTIVWQDWNIIKKGADGLSMIKEITDNMSVGFETTARDPLTTYYDKENPEGMSLEYKIGMENLKMKLKENEEFFGIERSIKF